MSNGDYFNNFCDLCEWYPKDTTCRCTLRLNANNDQLPKIKCQIIERCITKDNKMIEEKTNSVVVDKRPKTIFLDLDGCVFKHISNPNGHAIKPEDTVLLPGVAEKFNEWIMKDYKIILTTGRKECAREQTIEQLKYHGLVYDVLIMGLGGGFRVLINDYKPGNPDPTAVGITLPRNEGLTKVTV